MTVDTATLDGWFKERYADMLADVVPEQAILQKMISFEKSAKLGDSYHQPVKLTRSQGFTWNGGATSGSAFALNPAISMVTRDASVSGSELVLREQVSYGVLSRSGGKAESFGPAMDEVVIEMTESSALQQELALLYGGTHIGEVQANVAGALTILAATWAPGIWAQFLNAPLDAWDATLTIQRNTNAALLVGAINPNTRVVTVTGNALDIAAIIPTDVLVPRGANGAWFAGLNRILTNTGTLFGINGAVFDLFTGNTFSSGGAPLTMGKVQSAILRPVSRGLAEDICVLTSVYAWTDMQNDLAALRRYAESTKSGLDIGTTSIKFYGLNGMMEIKPHPMVMAGDTFCFPVKRFKRIGSTDITFELPDSGPGRFIRQLENNAALEVRNYWDLALYSAHLAKCVKINNIVNASGP